MEECGIIFCSYAMASWGDLDVEHGYCTVVVVGESRQVSKMNNVLLVDWGESLNGVVKKKSKITPIGQSLLTGALNRTSRPLPFLIASFIAATPLSAEEDVNDPTHKLPEIRRQRNN